MAKLYRTVYCLVWNDDKFPSVGDDLQLLWFHLKTTPFSTPLGIFYAPIAGLAEEKRWSLERYRKRLREGMAKGLWKVDERSRVIYFHNHFRWNKPENPNVLKGWLKSWDRIPECPLKAECYEQLREYCDLWGKEYAKVFETLPKRSRNVFEIGTGTGTGTGVGTGTGINSAPSDESLCADAPTDTFLTIPLNDKTEFALTRQKVEEWKSLYPAVDVEQECRNYKGWALANPKKRKTRDGIVRSIDNWLRKEQNRGRRSAPRGEGGNADALADFLAREDV